MRLAGSTPSPLPPSHSSRTAMQRPPSSPSPSTLPSPLSSPSAIIVGMRHPGSTSFPTPTLSLIPNPHAKSTTITVSVDPPIPFVLTFTDLTYHVKIPTKPSITVSDIEQPQQRKTILDSISGEARTGEILAILGASGSGKSTLIDALANRISRSSLSGSTTLNGMPLQSTLLKTISAYVMQDDLLFPMLTVEETLTFAAAFRLPRSLPPSAKKARVSTLIDQLGLRRAATTIIGDEGHRGVSGGERRRVSIGADIVHDPIVLFLDEPTSGLDSSSAFMVVEVLRRIARSGSVVVTSIHQPSARILGLIDRVMFLSRGRTVYSGEPEGMPGFFAEVGYPIPENESWTEFVLDLIVQLEGSPGGIDHLAQGCRSRQPPKLPPSQATSQSLKEAITASITRGKLVSGAPYGPSSSPSSVPTFANPFWVETAVLVHRSYTNSCRQPEIFATRLAVLLITGFLLATIFWRLDNTPKGVQERLGFFAFAMSTMFYTCADALPVFIQERYIYMRETTHNAYRRSSYVLANAVISFPPLVVLSIAFSVTTFFAVGLAGGASGFFFYFLVVLASFWAGSGFVTFLSAVVPHVMIGYVVVVAMLAYFLLFSGYFISRYRIPDYWIWFHYLSLVKYPYEAVMQNEFGSTGKCFETGMQAFDDTPLMALPAAAKERVMNAIGEAMGVEVTAETCVRTGRNILEQQGITQLSKWGCLWVTVAWGFLFRVLFYFGLMWKGKNMRK